MNILGKEFGIERVPQSIIELRQDHDYDQGLAGFEENTASPGEELTENELDKMLDAYSKLAYSQIFKPIHRLNIVLADKRYPLHNPVALLGRRMHESIMHRVRVDIKRKYSSSPADSKF